MAEKNKTIILELQISVLFFCLPESPRPVSVRDYGIKTSVYTNGREAPVASKLSTVRQGGSTVMCTDTCTG